MFVLEECIEKFIFKTSLEFSNNNLNYRKHKRLNRFNSLFIMENNFRFIVHFQV